MPQPIRGNILVLDDDATFRGLVRQLLEARGFSVVEAATADEATPHFMSPDTVLAIVDYRMPKMDGVSWIENLRNSGRSIPVVFCSAIPCDNLTFNRLRNILKVALIVRKPIIPESFIEQVESLLPGYERGYALDGVGGHTDYYEFAEASAKHEMAVELSRVQKRLELEKSIERAKNDYLKELSGHWRTLTELVDIHNNDKSRMDVLFEASHIAHRIRGTAGSLGLGDVSATAGKIEDMMSHLDGREDTDQEIIWSEVIRFIARGHEEITEHAGKITEPTESTDRPGVLIVSASMDVVSSSEETEVKEVAKVHLADSPSAVAECLAKNRVEAIFLEMTANKEVSFQRASDVRQMPGNHALPLGVFTTEDAPLSMVEQIYVGASVVVPHPVHVRDLHESISAILSMSNAVRPRVLAIDDDEVLCRFVAKVMESERIETKTCTNPIAGIELIDEFQPDVILLDVMMPALSGFEVCRRIRENPEWETIPVVFLTSKTSADSRNAAFYVGANDFVTKPVLAAELINRINNQLNESGLRRQSRSRDPETGVMNGDIIMAQAKLMLGDHIELNEPMSLALLTIDNYDQIALVQGHFGARQAARALGELLQHRFRGEDLRGRWSDGGYVLVLDRCNRDIAAGTIEMLQEDFSKLEFAGGTFPFTATLSAGVADSQNDSDSLEELIKAAHRKLKLARERAGSIGVVDLVV